MLDNRLRKPGAHTVNHVRIGFEGHKMTAGATDGQTLGWIGVGRMGAVLATRLLERGCDVSIYNRTRAKAEPLAAIGARLVHQPVDLADRDIVITMVAGSRDFEEVMTGPQGLLSDSGRAPGLVIDASTVSMDVSSAIRERAANRGVALLASPVSGNPKAARAGMLSVAVSGPRHAYDRALPYLQMLGRSVSYVGEGEAARLVKICHNLILGVMAQILAETTVLAERGGIARADYLQFINDSVMGSVFSRYKTPAYVNLNFTPTFTGHLLRKDFELGLEAASQLDVPLPLTALTHQIVVTLIGYGFGDKDFAALLEVAARGANLQLEPDERFIPDGLDAPEAPVAER
jgi:3-hydroxyisobutyrate dehydrogenase